MLNLTYAKLDVLYAKRTWLTSEKVRLDNFYRELSDAYPNLVQSSANDLPQTLRQLVLADVLDYARSIDLQDQDCIDYYETYTSCLYLAITLLLTTGLIKAFDKKPISIKMRTLFSVQVQFSYNQATKTVLLRPSLILNYCLRMQTLETVLATGQLSTLMQASLFDGTRLNNCIECITFDSRTRSLPLKSYDSFKDIALGFRKLNEEFDNNLLSALMVTI